MKVLFAHDHQFYIKDDSLYSKVDFGMAMWNRYLDVFDELVIAARIDKMSLGMDNSKMNKTPLNDSISVVALNSISGIKNLMKNKDREYQKLQQTLIKVDYVIARLPSEIGLMAIKIAKKNKIPYLIELVGSPFDAYWYHGSLLAKIYAPVISRRVKKSVEEATHVLYVTEKYLQAKYPTNNKEVNCSNINIKIDYDYNDLTRKIERYRNFENVKKIRIGLNGSLSSSYKGIDTAIDALSKLDDSYELHVLGAGPKEKWLSYAKTKEVGHRVFFEGSLPSGKAVLNWLDDIDIYIQPSKTEGLPRALIEAMSRGCVCIGSTQGGIPELLPPDKMHKPNDFTQLSKMIFNISSYSKEMLESSFWNFNKSKEYNYEILNKRRKDFLNDFKKSGD